MGEDAHLVEKSEFSGGDMELKYFRSKDLKKIKKISIPL